MNPELSKKLMDERPEMQDFVNYLKKEIQKLDSVQGLREITSPIDKAVEITGRERAIEILVGILSPLVNLQDVSGSDKDEYMV